MTAKEHTLAAERLLERHAGLSAGIAVGLVEAAGVGLARRHEPPTPLRITEGERHLDLALEWVAPDDRVRRAWGDHARATEWGAEALAIVAVDELRELVVVERALRGSHVDFYVGKAGGDLERAAALEVAGVDDGSIESLLRDKVRQARRNEDRLPMLAVAVRFREPCVKLVEVEEHIVMDDLHRRAMDLVGDAEQLFREGLHEAAREKYEEAAKLEQECADKVGEDQQRARGILRVSAVSAWENGADP